ncbi:acetyltransferase [Pyrenophora seminiperda CCB06]|uniref:Acetyltransferase n=1 Tax=Pyrenophora seminiperda CCB06 TaxID=1302712 RepID=A0A3M7M6Y8_9PLEO|nr:acetyltransferase [Pyrenophora seminiperda CCB06]
MASQTTPAHPAAMETQLEATSIPRHQPTPAPIVTTSSLMIRPMRLGDGLSTSLHANDPLINKYMSLSFPNPYTLSSAEAWIRMNMDLPYQKNFVICELSAPDVVIGGIGLTPGADVSVHTAELGFWVGQAYWGKGYMTEVLKAFTIWTFTEWEQNGQKLTRLWGGVMGGNVASMRCFEKCGYVKEGVWKGHCKKGADVMDLHFFGSTKLDWERRMKEDLEKN